MGLKYSSFLEELLEAKGWTKSELARKMTEEFQIEVKPEQVYAFFEGKNEPRAGFTKAVERVMGVNLHPRYYGFLDVRKP
jgi:ribosome-binding protein aMBF1 (putative translation factor)